MRNRDKFVLSKGHAIPAQYAALTKRNCFNNEQLKTLARSGLFLQGHPDRKKCPRNKIFKGSLG